LLYSLEEDFNDGFFGTHFALKNILQSHSGLQKYYCILLSNRVTINLWQLHLFQSSKNQAI
jgi:hypothetical protein